MFVDGQEVSQERWVSAKARDLLAYFVTMRGEKIPVDKVFDAIWGDKGGSSRTAFHTALSRLRNALKNGKESPRLILVEVREYWLDSARLTIDVDEFDSALAKARVAAKAKVRAEWYECAVSLYRGEYLQNLYYEWVFPERRRLAQSYLGALEELASYHPGGGLFAALPLLGAEPFLVTNGDVWTDLRLEALRRPAGSLAHLVLVPNPAHHPAGDLGFGLTYAGVSVLDPRLFDGCSPGAFPLKPLLERAQQAVRLTSQRHAGAWTDVGTPERLAALDAELRLGKLRHPVLASPVG